ncbi:unnamed protein product, partial [marine sediment metagenome]
MVTVRLVPAGIRVSRVIKCIEEVQLLGGKSAKYG